MQLTIKWFKLLLILCNKHYKLLICILVSPTTIISHAIIQDKDIKGIIIEIYDDTKFYEIDSKTKKISLGMSGTAPVIRGTIYATQTSNNDPAAVIIKVATKTAINSIIIGGTIDGAHAKNKQIMKESALIITSATNSLTNDELTIKDGIIIKPQGNMLSVDRPGVKGGAANIKIKQQISANINNFGMLESEIYKDSSSESSAICILGTANLLNGTITNYNLIRSKQYAILSFPDNTVDSSNRQFNFINQSTATVLGSIKLYGDNCKITNLGNIGQESGTLSETKTNFTFESATVTIENKKTLCLAAIASDKSNSQLNNSGTLSVINDAKLTKLDNLKGASVGILGTLHLTEDSTNSGKMQINSLTTVATFANYADVQVHNLDNCIINNQASLTVLTAIKNKVDISGELQLRGSVDQDGVTKVTNITGASATLVNLGSISIINNSNVAKIINNNNLFANNINFDSYTATTTYNFINNIGATAKVNNIKNVNIKNTGEFLVLNTIAGTVEVEGNIKIESVFINELTSTLIAGYLAGNHLENHGHVQIENDTKLSSIHNYLDSIFTNKKSLSLTKKSQNSGVFYIGSLTTPINDQGNELENLSAGKLTCESIHNARISNEGYITITKDISGEVTIISRDNGKLLFSGNVTNAANLFIDSPIANKKAILTNKGSMTVTQGMNVDQLINNNNLTINGTLTLIQGSTQSSVNHGNLKVNNLSSVYLTNETTGKILVDYIENSIINNTSNNPSSLQVNYGIKGNVKIEGSLQAVDNLTQAGTLAVTDLSGKSLQVIGKIQAKSIKLNNLTNTATSEIAVTHELHIGLATNDGVIATHKLVNNGVFYNTGKLTIGPTDFLVQEGSLINNGFVGCKGTFIVAGTMTNNGTLKLCELKGLNKYNVIAGTSNKNAKIGFSKLVTGNFVIKQAAYLTGDVTLSGTIANLESLPKVPQLVSATTTNAIIQSSTSTIEHNFVIQLLLGKNFKLGVATKNKVKILNDTQIGAINNLGSTIINGDLSLHATMESTNKGLLSAKAFSSVAKLTNMANSTLKFVTINQARITSTAANSRVEVSETLDSSSGETYIDGTLYFTGDIQQAGDLHVDQIQGNNHILSVTKFGDIVASTITLKALQNKGNIKSNSLFLSNNSTNKGTIITNNLTCNGVLYNTNASLTCNTICQAQEINGGKVVINNAITGDAFINSCVYINNQLVVEDNITVVIDQLATSANQNAKLIIGNNTTATIKQMLADEQLDIINQGAIKLKGGSILQSYFGGKASQLYVNIPTSPQNNEPLLTVRGRFICKTAEDIPAIIVTADQQPNQLTDKTLSKKAHTFILLSTNRLQLESSLTDLLAVQKVKSSSILFQINFDSPKITQDKNMINLAISGSWVDVGKIDSIKQQPISLTKMGAILQQFTRKKCKKAALLELNHAITQKKFRADSSKLLDYLLTDHSANLKVNKHLQGIQNAFFVNVNTFARDLVRLLNNLNKYEDYKKYLANKPVTPLLPKNFYDLIEQVLVDDSDIIDIANSDNLSSFLTNISNRLSIQNKSNINNQHKKTKMLYNKHNTYGWSSFTNQQTKDMAIDGYMINNYRMNLVNLGVDRVFNKLHLGWMFGYANTQVKNLGTRVVLSNRNHTYDIKTNASAIYASYKFDTTSANLAFIFGQSQQKENYSILKEEFSSNFVSNLVATMGEFIYSSNIKKLSFDIASKFELHYINTPQHSAENKISISQPTIQSNIKYRTVSHRINLGCEFSLYYTMKLFNSIDTKYMLSVRYMRNFNLRKDRLQELEFFKGLFNIQQQDYSRNNIYLNCLMQMHIQKAFNITLGFIASHKDYSKSLGVTASLQYNF